jgi:predicted Zn-dependent protease
MIMSKCYRASQNKPAEKQLRCITCHDPHVQPTEAEAPAWFNGKCMSCHTSASCKAPVEMRAHTAPGKDNCIGCHMQKREGIAISHTSITNHRIVKTPEEPFPEEAFSQTTRDLPDLIYLNRSAGESGSAPAITLLEAYRQLKDQSPAYAASYLRTLAELERTQPANDLVQAALGNQALQAGRLDQAEEFLQESLRLNATQPAVYSDLSYISGQKGRFAEAVTLAQKAVMLDPFNAGLHKSLILRLIDAKQYPEAEAAMEKYLEDFPEDDQMRRMLAIAKQP